MSLKLFYREYNLFVHFFLQEKSSITGRKIKKKMKTVGNSVICKPLRLCLPNWITMKHKLEDLAMTLGR